jgi:hypothetical protein
MSRPQLDSPLDSSAALDLSAMPAEGELVRVGSGSAARAPVNRVELRARLCGVGMWTPAYADFDAWVAAGLPDDLHVASADAAPPPALLLHPRLRRRTSTLTRATVTAVEAALAGSGVAIDQVRFVLVSSFGEIETTVELLAQLGEPGGPVSPTKFHNSVHNTATGYLSIASGNNRESTALAGGPHNLEIGLLEALAGLAETGEDVVLLFAEELLPRPFERSDADPTFAVALHLKAGSSLGESGLELRVSNRTRGPHSLGAIAAPSLPTMVAAHSASLPCSPIIELLRAVVGLRGGDLAISKRSILLAPGSDHAGADGSAVETEWTASLHPLEST